jgi:hypothetical protein
MYGECSYTLYTCVTIDMLGYDLFFRVGVITNTTRLHRKGSHQKNGITSTRLYA